MKQLPQVYSVSHQNLWQDIEPQQIVGVRQRSAGPPVVTVQFILLDYSRSRTVSEWFHFVDSRESNPAILESSSRVFFLEPFFFFLLPVRPSNYL